MYLPPFIPLPLFRNAHLQTICGAYWPDRWNCQATKIYRVELPDGDAIQIHENLGHGEVKPYGVLLVHGLGGSHASGYVRRTAAKLNAIGVSTFRIDLRGHGASLQTASRPGHAGRSDDVLVAAEAIQRLVPGMKLAVVGFSLGANIILKMAAELSGERPAWLWKLLAVAPPVDLQFCSENLATPRGRIYDHIFTRSAIAKVKQLFRLGVIPREIPQRWPSSLRGFDAWYTAPRSGFRDVDEYYSICSSSSRLESIQIPTTILSAADDPIVPREMFSSVRLSAMTKLVFTPHGGHLGFIGRRGHDADSRWLDWRIVEWVQGE